MGADPGPAAPALSSPPGAFLHIKPMFSITQPLQDHQKIPVCSPVSLWLITTGPGSSSTSRPGVTTRQSALEGGGDNLGGQVEVVPQVLDTLVGEVPAEYTFLNLLFQISCLEPYE